MAEVHTLQTAAFRLCQAVQVETRARPDWPVSINSIALRLRKSSSELHEAICYATMNGWLRTAGAPVHSLVLNSAGYAAIRRFQQRAPVRRVRGSVFGDDEQAVTSSHAGAQRAR